MTLASSSKTDIFALPRGHEFEPARLTISGDQVAAYLDATADRNDYGATAPPLAAVALALQALQAQFTLPDGTLHSGQEVEHDATVPSDVELTLRGRVAQRTERQGIVLCGVEFELFEGERRLLRAKSTIVTAGGEL